MQVIVHAGAHQTDHERLLKCLLSNKDPLSRRAVAVPGPGKYRTLLKESFLAMDAAEPSVDARDVLIDAILDEEIADRMILSNEHFFGSQRFALGDGQFYPLATRRLRQISRLFAGDEISLFLAICNPATFVPNLLSRASMAQKREILALNDPRMLRWTSLIASIREIVPKVSVTVWCNEDTPLIWGRIVRALAGLDPDEKITGNFDLLRDIMSTEGMQRLRTYLAEHKSLSEAQKSRVIAAFLDKYVIEDELEEELDLPGWTHKLVDELTVNYDHDVNDLRRLPGVRFIVP